jgi:N-acetylglutamate synthase-like GNAT family acetyltransferase
MWEYILLLILLVVVGFILYKMRKPILRTITGGGILQPTYAMASLGKGVFAYAVIKSKIIDLDEPLYKYSPIAEHDPRHKKITARHILSHTSGLDNTPKNKDIYFNPGTAYRYSGNGYTYLQKVIEHITKKPVEDFMKKYVFEPFDMSSTYGEADVIQGQDKMGRPVPLSNNPPSVRGGFKSTKSDYLKFLNCISNTKEYYQMVTPVYSMSDTIKAGLGFGIHNGYLFQHGSNPGYKHFVYWKPDDIFLNLTNTDNGFNQLFTHPRLFEVLKFINIRHDIKIRKIKKSDIKKAKILVNFYHAREISDVDFWEIAKTSYVDEDVRVIATLQDKLLRLIVVDPVYRSMGYGSAMMKHIKNDVRSLFIDKPMCSNLVAYYNSFGFVKTEETSKFIKMEMWFGDFEKENKLKIVKELARGWNGVIFLIDMNNKELIIKFDRYDKDEYNKQIEFNKVASKSKRFLTLYKHGIIKNCKKDNRKIPNSRIGPQWDYVRNKNKHNNCTYLIYEPVLKDTLLNTDITTPAVFYKLAYQIADGINTMRLNKYIHGDLHGSNIMIGYDNNWYIIDYGTIQHGKYKTIIKKNDSDDMLSLCYSLFLSTQKNRIFINSTTDKIPLDYLPEKQNKYRFLSYALSNPKQFSKIANVDYQIPFYAKEMVYMLEHLNDKTYDDILKMLEQKL